ncbi:GNAT family protein [Phytomonospora sp. NPDC050363]|uniref:GNAT family N-acetyltransferase n=1 Tax=Phytomonospora sp. NPDC050363 TaxID=3155642 RepID=UPI0033DA9769
MHPVELNGPRVTWRELTVDDAEAMVEVMSDPEVFRTASDNEVPDLEMYRSFIADYSGKAVDPERRQYKLALTLDGELVGTGGIEMTWHRSSNAEIGYLVSRPNWGKGLGTEAAHLLVDFALTELKAHRVWAGADVENPASIRILEKVGMTREGIRREDRFKDGRWINSAVYSILETDPRPSLR